MEEEMPSLESIQARMKKLQQQAETMIAKQAQAALDQIRQLMLAHGLTTEDIESRAKAKRESAKAAPKAVTASQPKRTGQVKGKLPPKYRDPKTGATWSGKARPPSWIAGAKDRTKFLIDAASALVTPAKPATKKAAAKKAAAKKAVSRKAAAKKTRGAGAVVKAAKPAAKKAAVKKAASKKTAAVKKVAGSNGAVASKRSAPAKKAVARKSSGNAAVKTKAAASPVSTAPAAAPSTETASA
jgi:DNA-binding protein H-NS